MCSSDLQVQGDAAHDGVQGAQHQARHRRPQHALDGRRQVQHALLALASRDAPLASQRRTCRSTPHAHSANVIASQTQRIPPRVIASVAWRSHPRVIASVAWRSHAGEGSPRFARDDVCIRRSPRCARDDGGLHDDMLLHRGKLKSLLPFINPLSRLVFFLL